MSEELKNKLYDYEVKPAEGNWSAIRFALDEEVDAAIAKKLLDAEILPPAGIWNKITEALDKGTEDNYVDRLKNLSIEPPPKKWSAIAALLDEPAVVSATPAKIRSIRFLKYAAAACLVGLVAFGAIKLISRQSESAGLIATSVNPQKSVPSNILPDSQRLVDHQPATAFSNNLPKEKILFASNEMPATSRRLAQTAYMTQSFNPSPLENNAGSCPTYLETALTGEVPGNCSTIADADRYLMYMNPNGYLIRISKKLAETLGCIYNKGNSREYNQCEEQMKKWREKIAQSPASSSPDNFMDVIDIIKSVKDN